MKNEAQSLTQAKPSNHPYIGFFAFIAVILLLPFVVKNVYLLNVMVFAGINTILVIGLNLLMGYAGQISLGHAGFYGLGAYVYGVLAVKFGVHPWLSVLVALLSTSLTALTVGYPSLKLKGHYLAIATLGFGIIFQICFIQFSSLTGGPSGLSNVPQLSIGSLVFDNDFKDYYLVWIFAAVILLLSLNLIDSRSGRALRAVDGSELAAQTLGVNTAKYKIQVFVMSAAFASIAGSLYAHCLTFVAPQTFGFMTSVILVVMVAVGGIGSFWGSIIGAIGLTILPEYLRAYEDLEGVIYGVILIIGMMFMPKGFVGVISTLFKRVSRNHFG